MVYTLVDMDTNKDGKLDVSDIKALYLSKISGDKFTKVSADFQELIDWDLIESKNRLYFFWFSADFFSQLCKTPSFIG